MPAFLHCHHLGELSSPALEHSQFSYCYTLGPVRCHPAKASSTVLLYLVRVRASSSVLMPNDSLQYTFTGKDVCTKGYIVDSLPHTTSSSRFLLVVGFFFFNL